MSRIHIALNSHRFEESLAFYSQLFGQAPNKLRDGWAKFDLADPALNLTLNRGDQALQQGHLNHLGVEVEDAEAVARMDARLRRAGLETTPETDVTCCYARQDKTWVVDPDGHAWEFFYVKDDA